MARRFCRSQRQWGRALRDSLLLVVLTLGLGLVNAMLVPVLQKTAAALALAASLSSNAIVPDLPSTFEGKEAGFDGGPRAHLVSPARSPSSHWISSTRGTAKRSTAASIPPLPFRRFNTAADIPPSYFESKKVIRGRVAKVIDGDTIRIRHTPTLRLPFAGDGGCGAKISECTISVRLYGVDAPETAKFGDPGQPCAEEAKQHVSDLVSGRVVRVKLLRRDRYSRAIGKVTIRDRSLPFLGRTDLSASLAERGYASLYTGGGAEYDGARGELEGRIRIAQERRRGIWSDGVDNFVDPAKYKREMRAKKNGGQQ